MDTNHNEYLFFKCFRNVYIKNRIFHQLKLYYANSKTREFESLRSYLEFRKEYKFIEYVESIKITIKNDDRGEHHHDKLNPDEDRYILNHDIDSFESIIPKSCRSLSIHFFTVHQPGFIRLPKIPLWIETFEIGEISEFLIDENYFDKSEASCLKTLKLYGGIYRVNNYDDSTRGIKPNTIPNSVTSLYIESFNGEPQPRNDTLPTSLIKLYLGNSFNEEIKPNVISHLVNLKHLEFGCMYDKNLIPRSMPPNLETLIYKGRLFRCGLDVLPNSLKTIKLSSSVCNNLKDGVLPNNLVNIDFGSASSNRFTRFPTLSKQLVGLKLGNDQLVMPIQVPTSLELLELGLDNYPLLYSPKFSPLSLVSAAGLLFLDDKDKQGLFPKDSKLKTLHLGTDFNYRIGVTDLSMCKHLTKITFSSVFNKELVPNAFPPSVTYLSFDNLFNNGGIPLVEDCFPPNLEYLNLGSAFSQDITIIGGLSSLKVLKLGTAFKKSIEKLPASLGLLELNGCTEIKEIKGTIPNSLSVKLICKHYNPSKISIELIKLITNLEFQTCSLFIENPNLEFYLPPNLKSLLFTDPKGWNNFKTLIPNSITSITFPKNFNNILGGNLKDKVNLTYLDIQTKFLKHPLLDINELPNSIQVLKLGYYEYQYISSSIFPSLVELHTSGSPILNDDEVDFKFLKKIFCTNSKFLESLDLEKYLYCIEFTSQTIKNK